MISTLRNKSIGEIIKVKENDEYVDYILVHKGKPSVRYDDSCHGAWLLRKDAITSMAFSDTDNSYATSNAHKYLNNEFINRFSESMRNLIKTVKIPYKKGNSAENYPCMLREEGLETKAFLLYVCEVLGIETDTYRYWETGDKLQYFTNLNNKAKICKNSDGAAIYWWLRTPYLNSPPSADQTSNVTKQCYVHPNGDTGSTYGSNVTSTSYYIRPTIILPLNMVVNDQNILMETSEQIGLLNSRTIGEIVQLKENGEWIDYIVINKGNPDVTIYDDSCNGVWLMRKSAVQTAPLSSSAMSDTGSYIQTTTHAWLNNNFLERFDEATNNLIKSVKIPYQSWTYPSSKYSFTYNKLSNGFSAKAFLLSGYECGFSSDSSHGNGVYAEGKTLPFFLYSQAYSSTNLAINNASVKLNKLCGGLTNEGAIAWWLRDFYYAKGCNQLFITSEGLLQYTSLSSTKELYGIRPVMILPFNAEIDENGHITGQLKPQLLGHKELGDTIKINENGVACEYTIINIGKPSDLYDDSCNGVWLLKKYPIVSPLTPTMNWDTSDNDYANSDIKDYLNNQFLDALDESLRTIIKTVKIPYKKGTGNSNDTVQTGINGLQTKIFLLSKNEVSQNQLTVAPYDGDTLQYFYSTEIAKLQLWTDNIHSTARNYWLRTCETTSTSISYYINSNGNITTQSVTTGAYIRPAFIIPAYMVVDIDNNLVPNTLPIISANPTGDLGVITNKQVGIEYSVDDDDLQDVLTVTEYLDNTQTKSFVATRKKPENILYSGVEWLKIANGTHKIKISCSDTKDFTDEIITFTRDCDKIVLQLASSFPADDRISACYLNVEGSIPADAICKYEVTNNANDPTPVWEDCTNKSKAGFSYGFANKTAENGFAFSFRISIQRGMSGAHGYITNISGGFE